MTRPDRNAWRAFSAFLMLAALATSSAPAQAAGEPSALPAPDQSFVSGKDLVVYPPDHGTSFFRFLPDGQYIPYDRSLTLSATPGETRAYLMQVTTDRGGSAEAPVTGYVIDKTRPRAPSAEPATGLFREALKPVLTGEEGADIFWTLVGPDGGSPSFSRYGEDSRPSLRPPASGTATYTVLAYSVDQSGNRSYPSRFVYRLAEAGLPAAAPQPDSLAIAVDDSLPKPELEAARGYSELRLAVPPGAALLLDVDPESPPSYLGDFERISADGGVAKLRLPCPYGWAGDLTVYYGLLRDGVATYSTKPLGVHLSNPADEVPLPAAPEAPTLAADPAGRGAFAAFPSYDGALFASVDGSAPSLYAAPIALPRERSSVKISWYGEDDLGQRSASSSILLALPELLPDIALTGVADGAAIAGDVTLKPAAKATLRYEIRLDGTIPPEPTFSSPLLGDSLALSCPAGEERAVVLRYRAFSGGSGGEGRVLRFSLDRKPPDPPRPAETPTAYSDKAVSLSLVPGTGGKDVFASVSADGINGPFAPVKANLELAGSDAGPVTYIVRAYDLDAAGNKSTEMKSLTIIVDRSSVYAAEDGGDKGDGSPDRPFKSIDAALASALKSGRRSVNLRGAFEMRAPVVGNAEISLAGGFGKLWAKDPSARATVRVSLLKGQTAFTQKGGSLSFNKVDLSADSAGPGPLISLSNASLAVADSSIVAGADGDLLIVSALRSRIAFSGSRIKATRAMSGTAFSSDSSDISISGSTVAGAKGVRIFGAFDMDGGSLSISQSLIDSGSDLGLNLLSLRSASLLVDRSLIKAEGGSGFLRLGSFKSVKGEIKNSKALVLWKGPGVLFEISDGGPAFRHDTIVADSDKGGLRFFDVQGTPPQVWNCILECSGGGSELYRSGSAPGQGVLVADCVWGFDRLLSGAYEASDLDSLNALNADQALYSARPIISEAPERTFAAAVKAQAPLRPDSACVSGALPLSSGYDVDFSGHRRPGPGREVPGNAGPDIGAEELAD